MNAIHFCLSSSFNCPASLRILSFQEDYFLRGKYFLFIVDWITLIDKAQVRRSYLCVLTATMLSCWIEPQHRDYVGWNLSSSRDDVITNLTVKVPRMKALYDEHDRGAPFTTLVVAEPQMPDESIGLVQETGA